MSEFQVKHWDLINFFPHHLRWSRNLNEILALIKSQCVLLMLEARLFWHRLIRTTFEGELLAHLAPEVADVMRILAQVHLVVICSKLRHLLVLEVWIVAHVLISKLHVLVRISRMEKAVVILIAFVTHGSWSCIAAVAVNKLRHRHIKFDGLGML